MRSAGRWRARPWVQLGLDAAALAGAFMLSYYLRILLPNRWLGGIQEGRFYILPGLVVAVICLVSLVFHRVYEDRRCLGKLERYVALIRAVAVGILLATAVTFLFKIYNYSRGLLLAFWTVGTVAICLERLVFYRVLGILRARGFDNVPVATITPAGQERLARGMLANFPELGYRVVEKIAIGGGGPGRGLKSLAVLVQEGMVEMIVFGVPERDFHRVVPYLAWCEEHYVPYHRMSGNFDVFYRSAGGRDDPVYLEPKPVYSAVKAVADRLVALASLVVSSPLWLFLAILIKLESPGPVLFNQDRVGKNGKLFRMFKFRTMYAHSPRYAMTVRASGDRRVTAIGAFLRRTSLDELPQLLNVLNGDMSLVGPRPEMPFMIHRNAPQYKMRLMILPGLTGLWQAMAREVPLEKALPYDLYYIKHRSLIFDLVIIFRTVLTVATGKGAR